MTITQLEPQRLLIGGSWTGAQGGRFETTDPWTGVKASGWGRFGGKAAIEEFTELRWITVQHGSRHYPL